MTQAMFRDCCRKKHVKVTPQRLAIYAELSKSTDHPSTDRIFQKIRKRYPGISFDTVNRTLLMFVNIGLVHIVEGAGGRLFDPILEDHHHLRCLKCYSVIDFYNEAYDRLKLPKKIPGDFKVLSRRVVLEGICHNCNTKKRKTSHENSKYVDYDRGAGRVPASNGDRRGKFNG